MFQSFGEMDLSALRERIIETARSHWAAEKGMLLSRSELARAARVHANDLSRAFRTKAELNAALMHDEVLRRMRSHRSSVTGATVAKPKTSKLSVLPLSNPEILRRAVRRPSM